MRAARRRQRGGRAARGGVHRVRDRGAADGSRGRRVPARARAERRDDAARLLLRGPRGHARRDGGGRGRLRRLGNSGLSHGRGVGRRARPLAGPRGRPPALRDPGLGRPRGARDRARPHGVVWDEPRAILHGILAEILLRDEGGRRVYGDPGRIVTKDACATLERVRDGGRAAVSELLPEFSEDLARIRGRGRASRSRPTCSAAACWRRRPRLAGAASSWRSSTLLAAAGAWSLHEEARAIGWPTVHRGWARSTGNDSHLGHGRVRRCRRPVVDARIRLGRLPRRNAAEQHAGRAGRHRPRTAHAPGTRLPSLLTPTLVLEENRPAARPRQRRLSSPRRSNRAGRVARSRRDAVGRGRHRRTANARRGLDSSISRAGGGSGDADASPPR